MPVVNRTPYRNLILTGTIGTGKTGVGRRIAERMEGAEFVDLEIELEQRAGMSAEKIRENFGIARLRSLESEMLREITLRRSTVIAVSGTVLLAPANLERLQETGPVLCLTAALGEILRRIHVMQGGRFHQRDSRAVVVGRIKREQQVLALDLPRLDTTDLSLDDVTQQAIDFWMMQSDT